MKIKPVHTKAKYAVVIDETAYGVANDLNRSDVVNFSEIFPDVIAGCYWGPSYHWHIGNDCKKAKYWMDEHGDVGSKQYFYDPDWYETCSQWVYDEFDVLLEEFDAEQVREVVDRAYDGWRKEYNEELLSLLLQEPYTSTEVYGATQGDAALVYYPARYNKEYGEEAGYVLLNVDTPYKYYERGKSGWERPAWGMIYGWSINEELQNDIADKLECSVEDILFVEDEDDLFTEKDAKEEAAVREMYLRIAEAYETHWA